jgi:transposase
MSLSLQSQADLKDMLVQCKSYSAIAKKFSISRSTITKYKKKLNISLVPNKGGRPRSISAKDSHHIVHAILSRRVDTAPQVKRLLGLTVSNQTVRNVHRAVNLWGRAKVNKPLLTNDHWCLRLDFAYTHRYKTPDNWARIIFSDETKINRMGSDGHRYCWKAPGEELSKRTVHPVVKHGGGSTMVWGSMTMKGVGRMCVIEGIMDAEKYVKILDKHLLATARSHLMHRSGFIFQQDNDPKHTSAKAKNWIQDHQIELLKWPPQSADLNPIEHLWEHLKRRLNSYEPHPTSVYELEKRIKVEWNNIDPEVCRNLILSMPDRIEAVIRAKGGNTKY